MFTAQLAAQLAAPALVVIIGALGTPLLVFLLRLLDARTAAIQNLARDAVHAVEQVMWTAPSAEKKAVAVRILIDAGVPASLAGPLVESGVHAMNTAAASVLATPPAAPVVAVPVVEVPAGPPQTQPH
jgi:predicted nuclease of predicted toxin-antitoxin system